MIISLRTLTTAVGVWLMASTSLLAQVSVSTLNSAYTQDFNTLAATGTTNDISTLPVGWLFLETGSNANTTYAASTGSSNAGNTYSLGLDTDRALGGLQSGSLIPTLGASFTNNTGATITALQISYFGEQWRLGATPRVQADRLDFQYSLNATSLATGTWINEDALDFNAPILSGTVGLLNGNADANRTLQNFTIEGLAIPDGATFWIRWQDFNVAGADDALGIDDFSLTPIGIPSDQPALTLTPSNLNFGEINIGTSKILSYMAVGANLTDSLTIITSLDSTFSLSLDQVVFSNSIAVADSSLIYVKFSPLIDGSIIDTLFHQNGTYTKTLVVSGSAYDPLSNIIPIATARSLSVGSKVTVAGRITVSNQLGSPAYIQDATGGIPVFDFTLSNAVAIGDSVIVTGPIGVFNDQKQISGAGISFTKADSSQRVLSPKLITLGALAANEGLLVTVQNVEIVNKSFVFFPQSTELITNDTIQADLRIDGDTNLPGLAKPQGLVNITGVVGRFRTNAQLLPRFREDVPGAQEPQTPADSIPTSATFDLLSWNLEFFGATREDYPEEFGPADEALQLQNVKQVLNSLQADVIAVQEVSSDSLFYELVNQLPGYKGICSDRFSYSFEGPSTTFPPQKVCFIYDSATVSVVNYRAMFENLYDSARTINNALLPGYPTGSASSFWSSGRLPFLLTADVTINGVTERINFVNLHAKSGATQSDWNRRAYDVQVLKDSLDTYFATEQVVILGDLNDDLDQSIVNGQPTSYEVLINDTTAYKAVTLPLSLSGARSTIGFNDMIDHQIISAELNEEYIEGSASVITPFGSIVNYGTTTSDHLPVLTRYAFNSSTISFVGTSSEVMEAADSVEVHVQVSRASMLERTVLVQIEQTSTATYGEDYTTLPAPINETISVVIPAGSTTGSFVLTTVDDTIDETNEVINFTLLSTQGLSVNDSSTFTVTILDDDASTVEFAEAAVSREEGSGAYTVRLPLSLPQTTEQHIVIRVTNGQGVFYGSRWDYTTTPIVSQGRIHLTIPAGVDEVTFTVTPNTDILPERRPETITFTLESVGAGLAIGTQKTFVFTIIDVRPCIPLFGVFPNPTFGIVNIFTLPANQDNLVQGTLYGPAGEVLTSGEGTVAALSDLFTNTLQGRRRGFYTLRLVQCDEVITIRILKL